MGRRGPAPKPTQLKILEGNRSHRPLNFQEPKPEAGRPDEPDCLDAIGLEEWRRIIPQLEKVGVLTKIDGNAIATYCYYYSLWKRALRALKHRSLTYKARQGTIPRPEIKIARDAAHQMKLYAAEFGMTPASRSRITTAAPKNDGTQKDKARFFRTGRTGA